MKKLYGLSVLSALSMAAPAMAAMEVDLGENGKLTFGGYIKVDARYVDGDVAYQDYWRGNNPGAVDTSHFAINVRETRINTKYVKGDVTGFIEMDFYGGGGNEVATNSSNPRLRHAFLSYKNLMVGQYWSTFMPLAALPESLDFAGPIAGEVFVRQQQIRYTMGNLRLAIENPETFGDGDVGNPSEGGGVTGAAADPDESNPDLIGSYTFTGDWGEVTTSGLLRWIDQGGVDDVGAAVSVSGKINFDQDDLRFQFNYGDAGRYIGAAYPDVVDTDADTEPDEVEEVTALTVAYRHIWSKDYRSTVYFGGSETDVAEQSRYHYAANLIRQLTPDLWAGVELGNFTVDDDGSDKIDAFYLQFSMKFTL